MNKTDTGYSLDWLISRFEEFGDSTALVWNDSSTTYKELADGIGIWRQRLRDCSIDRPQVTLLGNFSPNVLMLFFATIAEQGTIAPIPDVHDDKIDLFNSIAESNIMISFSDDDHYTIKKCETQKICHPLLGDLSARKIPGLILFTSGSTGASKAAVHDLQIFLKKFQKVKSSLRSLAFLSLDHIGGINTILNIFAGGGTAFTTADRSVAGVCAAIEKHRIEVLPTSPTFLNMLVFSGKYREYDLSSLSMITYGTEPMPIGTLNLLNKELPNIRFKQTYGLTELGILPSRSKDSNSLWMQIGGQDWESKIVNNILWLRTKSAMLGYLNAPHPFDQEGWYNTHDAVEQEDDYIRVLGRTSEIINVGGEKVYPAEVEGILLEMPEILDAAVTAQKNPIMGNVVVATISLKDPSDTSELLKRVRQHCRGRLEPYKIPVAIRVGTVNTIVSSFKKNRLAGKSETDIS